ncbi:MAG: BamA/TamA family outer membrane protein, partial [Fidelibacterota bacterium]
GESQALSDVLTGVFQLSLSHEDQKLVFSGYSGIGWDIYSVTRPLDLSEREVSPSNFVSRKQETGPQKPEVLTAETDSDRSGLGASRESYSRYIFALEYDHLNRALLDTMAGKPMEPLAQGEYKNPDGSYRTQPYKTRFTLDLVSGQAGYSNVFGYIGTTLFAFSDILGDHRIFVGTEMVVNLENSDYFLWYDFLKYRNNFSVSLFHTANFFGSVPEYIVRLRHLSLDFSISHPFNRFQRTEFALSHHFINQREYQGVGYTEPPEIIGDETLRLLTYRASWVFDNSSWGFTGPNDGWRANAQFFQSLGVFRNRIDFKTILLDARRYIRLSRLYSLAFRMSLGHSFGRNPQKFFLGGTENWILGTGETQGVPDGTKWNNDIRLNTDSTDYLKDIYFSIFILPVRGSRLVERWGTNVLLTNAEFRFPFVNYLALGFPLKVIFGNIHGVLFADVGMAWDDRPRLYGTTESGEKKFDDLIAGYGLGIRINLGYTILRVDTAWDFTLQVPSKPQYYLSLGTDL